MNPENIQVYWFEWRLDGKPVSAAYPNVEAAGRDPLVASEKFDELDYELWFKAFTGKEAKIDLDWACEAGRI